MLVSDLLPQTQADYVRNVLLDLRFPHYYRANLNSGGYTHRYDDDHTATGFSHNYFDDGVKQSDAFDVVMPYLWALLERKSVELTEILRVRSVLTLPTGRQHSGFPHIDLTGVRDYYTAVVYVAGYDGDTVLYRESFDGTILPDPKDLTELYRITPKPNSGFVFNGLRYHTAFLPTTSKVRLSLNFNFRGKYAGIGDTYDAVNDVFVAPVSEFRSASYEPSPESTQG